ncbi:MAG: N-acetylmuramoyl-L-alanine amidase [Bryobacterales bacterium]|nr:N-acetylmuramoyl-L-alanine amidase [Bryobacterales bacterium]
MRSRILSLAGLTLLSLPSQLPAAGLSITAVRFWSLGEVTRIAIETDGTFQFRSEKLAKPQRVFFDLQGARPRLGNKGVHTIPVNDPRLKQIRVAENQPGLTRIVLDLEEAQVEITTSQAVAPDRLLIEVKPVNAAPPFSKLTLSSSGVERIPVQSASTLPLPQPAAKPPVRALLPEGPALSTRSSKRPQPVAMSLSLTRVLRPTSLPPPPAIGAGTAAEEPVIPAAPLLARVAPPSSAPEPLATPAAPRRTSAGDRTLTRMLGLKIRRVVLDPGHGGHDHGTTGPGGAVEKDLVLDVARRLGALIEERLGSEVFYTRSKDNYLTLEERVAFANQKRADLFLSVHANSSPIKSAAGAETYYLSFAPSRAAQELAARENAGSQRSISELRDIVMKIAAQEKIGESREFALNVQSSLTRLTGATAAKSGSRRDRGVKRAPFIVLIGASMPAILTEIGFVTNPKEESLLKKPEYRQKLAESIYKGVQQYADSLSQMEVAQTARRVRGE